MIINPWVILFFGSVGFGLLMGTFNLIGASVYDFKQIQKLKKFVKNSRKYRNRPLVSIIIPSFNEAGVIERCLDSILKSSYKKFEIIVVDDASKDKTKQVVADYIKSHRKFKIKLVVKRKNAGRGGALNAGFKKSKGQLIMALDADCTLDKPALKNIVRHFAMDAGLSALASNVRIMPYPSMISLLQEFEYITNFRTKKVNTFANAEYIIGGSGAVYRREIFQKLKGFNETMLTEDIALSLSIAKLGNKQFKLFYGSDVIVYTEPVPSYRSLFNQRYRWKLGILQAMFHHRGLFFSTKSIYTKLLSWFYLPLAALGELLLLAQPFLLVYFVYLSVNYSNPKLFVISWAAISFMIVFAIWSDENLSLKRKARLTLLTPIMYTLFYVLTVIQILAILKCAINIKKIVGAKPMRGNWSPPERITATSRA